MKRIVMTVIFIFLVTMLIFTGGKVYAYSNGYVNSYNINAPFIDIYMTWDNAVFTGTYSYIFTETNKFTKQQTQLIYQGTDTDPITSNIGEYISDIAVRSHNYKLNGATLIQYISENETSFSGISAVADHTYSPKITVVATGSDLLGCKFEVIGQGYNRFNGEIENNRSVTFN